MLFKDRALSTCQKMSHETDILTNIPFPWHPHIMDQSSTAEINMAFGSLYYWSHPNISAQVGRLSSSKVKKTKTRMSWAGIKTATREYNTGQMSPKMFLSERKTGDVWMNAAWFLCTCSGLHDDDVCEDNASDERQLVKTSRVPLLRFALDFKHLLEAFYSRLEELVWVQGRRTAHVCQMKILRWGGGASGLILTRSDVYTRPFHHLERVCEKFWALRLGFMYCKGLLCTMRDVWFQLGTMHETSKWTVKIVKPTWLIYIVLK